MKRTLFALLAVVALCVIWPFSAHAAALKGEFGFKLDYAPLEGGESDSQLTAEDITKAFLEGVRTPGLTLVEGKKTKVYVHLSVTPLYYSGLNNLRVLHVSMRLRDTVISRGSPYDATVCDIAGTSWRAGPSVPAHLAGLKETVGNDAKYFAQTCLLK